jgi:AcrR family transcriptional regulator
MADEGPEETLEPVGEGDGFDSLPGTDRINRLLREEMGQEMADAYAVSRAVQERWTRRRHPHEGLRERKKRLTRQQISDVATTLFIVRGFERVTVAQVAEIVGVSEKTVYNYFPTKESLIFDRADEGSERLASALRERGADESPTQVLLKELAQQSHELEELPEESHMLLPLFAEMVATTPALRAAWLELQDRLAAVVRDELARHADVDPREPEPMIAARAMIGLTELSFQSRIRHVEAGLRGAALAKAVGEDLERAARLLDTGLASFDLLAQSARTRSQLSDAARAAEEARKQVMEALKQARTTWRELRGQAQEQSKQQREDAKRAAKAQATAIREEAKRAAKAQVAAAREEAKRAARAQVAAAREEAMRATKAQVAAAREEAKRTAARKRSRASEPDGRSYEEFRRAMAARHEAIRARREDQADPPGQATSR